MIGQTFSHYTIVDKLGEGGMGVVYKAHDLKLDRDVALKFLPSHLAASETDKNRFIQEARAASALNHPNVCTIHDILEHDGRIFIVMELVDGQTLRARMGSLSAKQALEAGIQIADGLAAAHEKGIVHRDIKPENIMIRRDGLAQIMDFGLAKLRANSSKITRLTREGSTVGTAGYMSPEQVRGQDADHRSDIFSLGVLLYELLTGELPFKGVHETALAYEIVNVDPPPMSSVRAEIYSELDRIVLECLEKDPSERYQSAAEISKDLKRCKRESGRQRMSRITAARPVVSPGERPAGAALRPRWKTLLWPALALASTAALAVVLWAPWHGDAQPRLVTRVGLTLPNDQELTTTSYSAVAISPDGSRLVYKANGRLYLRNLNSFSSVPLPGAEQASGPFFSPDGKWLGFFVGGKLNKVPISGGASTTLADGPDNRGAAWGRNGDVVFSPNVSVGLMRVRGDGGEVQVLTVADTTRNERTHRWPHFLPDGKTVLFTVGTMDSPDYYDDAVIEAVDITTGKRKTIMKGGCSASYISPGFLVYWRSSALFAVAFDPERVEITGTSFPVVEDVNGDPTTGMAGYATAENGTMVYIPGNAGVDNQSLVMIDHAGAVATLPAPVQSYMEPRLSPDGKRIAVVCQSGKDTDIWVYDIIRNTLSKLTFGGNHRTPTWSSDGRRIAYYSFDNGRHLITMKLADGSGAPDVIDAGRGRSYVDCWSKDGSLLILDRGGMLSAGGSDILVLPLTGDRKPRPWLATRFDEWQANLSPDGKWIAYVSNITGTYQVYLQPFPEGAGRWQISTDEGSEPRWSADGKTLFYYSPGRMIAVPVETSPSLVLGKPRVLFSGYQKKNVDSGLNYDVSPDGRSFVTTKSAIGEDNFRQINLVLNWAEELKNKSTLTN